MRGFLLCTLLLSFSAQAAPWEFAPVISVTQESKPGVFTHLESAGRKNIAVSEGWVAVAWEDNRDGTPRCYVALKAPGQNTFGETRQISGKQEAAEPAIVGLDKGRFALAWEEADHVWARIITNKPGKAMQLAEPLALSDGTGAQASLSFAAKGGLVAVWSEQGERFWQIKLARVHIKANGDIQLEHKITVDGKAEGDQSYPSIAALSGGKTMVAWEDRRAGNTRLFYAASRNESEYSAPPQQLNESLWREAKSGIGQGGTGVMRVALAAQGSDGVAAVWADKRDFRAGYDVYAGFAHGPEFKFGANEKVQDEFGDNIAQWHPALASNADGRVVAVWDDDRDGSPDVWLAWRKAEGWSGDLAVPGASGAGVQSDPSIAMDDSGNLHLAWVEKADLNGPSTIKYSFARATEK
jgi:hypothetical protein